MPHQLTDVRKRLLKSICRRPVVHAVTYRELMREFGWRSPQAVMGHMRALAEMGYVEMPNGKRGGIRVLINPEEATDGDD